MIYSLMGTGAGSFLGWDQLMGKSLPPKKLKTDGFYRHVRHPLYTLGFIIIWLFPWMTANWQALIASTTIYLVVGALLEERKMLQQFGEEYAQYKARTPMLMPDLQKILKG
jgi:protein-S-isoprenylcysteine O-methyltransferase Ste14